MKLASFDIGIKNMAYCVFDISPSTHSPDHSRFQVVDWAVIDLTGSEKAATTMPGCTHILQSSRAKSRCCGKKAKYTKNEEYMCETHAKSHSAWILPAKEHTLSFLKKLHLKEIAELYRSLHLDNESNTGEISERSVSVGIGSFSGETPKALCIENIPTKPKMVDAIYKHYNSRVFSKIQTAPKHKANDVHLLEIGRTIRRVFDTLEHFRGVTHVVIENQISPIAARMKTIQGMLAQYFIMKTTETAPIHIAFVSSSNKLRISPAAATTTPTPAAEAVAAPPTRKPRAGTDTIQTPNYKQNKKDGVSLCQRYISENPSLEKWAENLKVAKKDDLADCFLQGIWYMANQNIISCAENLKINIV